MADRTGQQLGNYRIIRPIGRGGFAEVYLGEHIYLKTQVAIKLLRTTVANPEDLEGFLKESQTVAHLVHPHIVRVMDFGVDGETPYLVMDYASNGTLRQRHPKGIQLPLTTITPYVKQVAAALQHAHNEKVIHRDIKPENMLLGRYNDVLLSDFGIALIAQSSRYQSTQEVIGTVAYMSPEQIQGKPRPASDQYSLAIVVYEWLTGDRPFHGSFTELCTQHMFAPPSPLREKVPTISPDVERVVMTALAKDSHQRFGSVQAFANALEQSSQPAFVLPQPVPLLPPPSPPTEQKPITPPPPQAVPISPQPPIQYAGGSPLQEMRLPSNARGAEPITSPSGGKIGTAESKGERLSIWRIGKRQLVAGIIGFAITACLSIPLPFAVSYPYPVPPVIALLLLGLILVTPEFFGAVFGPWVGLFTGVGPLAVYIIDSSTNYGFFYDFFHYEFPIGVYWPIQLGVMLVGFISGFALFKTKISVAEIKREKVNIWKIGKRQLVAALIGFAIVACLSIPIGFSVFYPYTISPVIGLLCLSLILVTPEFFGAVFGPLVGLFTGIGLLVGYIIDNNTDRHLHFALPISVFLPILLGVSAVCFISGFAMFKTKGRYNIGRTLGLSSLGAAVGSIFAIFIDSIQDPCRSCAGSDVLGGGSIALGYIIVGLMLLPILLVVYNSIAERRKPASTML